MSDLPPQCSTNRTLASCCRSTSIYEYAYCTTQKQKPRHLRRGPVRRREQPKLAVNFLSGGKALFDLVRPPPHNTPPPHGLHASSAPRARARLSLRRSAIA